MGTEYDHRAFREVKTWQQEMAYSPSLFNRTTHFVQRNINRIIPERVHTIVTNGIKQMVRGVLFGSEYTTKPKKSDNLSLEQREKVIRKRIRFYRNTAAAEGAATGFGGFIWGLADFPLWLSLKMKMLFDIASRYGFDTRDYRERLYILHVFQITFSNQQRKNELIVTMKNWEREKNKLPDNIHDFDWRTFQLEYRDYIDLAKLLQLIPGFGAIVGFYVNHKLTDRLGVNAMNAYRMRMLEDDPRQDRISGK